MHLGLCVFTCASVCIYLYICVSVYVCVHVRMCMSVCLCVFVLLCVSVYISVCVCVWSGEVCLIHPVSWLAWSAVCQ